MKKNTKGFIIPLLALMALFSACKKQDIAVENQQEQIRATGLIPDDPSKIGTVSLVVSKEYLMKASPAKKPVRGGSTSDIIPPTVAITSPANGSTVSGDVLITVTSSDNVGVKSLTVTVNGALLGTSSSSSASFTWNTSNYQSGVYTIEATAKDAAGNASSYAIAVTKDAQIITPPPPPPPSSTTEYSLATPPIQYQGSEFSCVAFAVAYAARSIEEYYRTGATSYSQAANVFSPEYLYNQTKASSDCGSGSNIMMSLDLLKNQGVATWASMPYSYMDGCATMPNATQMLEASRYKISSYSYVYTNDVTAIKSLLNNKHAVIIGLTPDNSFYSAKSGFIWKSFSSSPVGSHAVVICGYDDSKNAWKIMNSWGTSWGDAGYGWIDYNFLPTAAGGWGYVMNY